MRKYYGSNAPFLVSTMKNWCGNLLLLLFAPSRLALNPSPCDNGALIGGNATQCGTDAFCNEEGFCKCGAGYFTPGGSATDCRSIDDPDPPCFSYSLECIFCGSSYEGPCLKCASFITSNAECVDKCVQGFQIKVIPNTTLSARVCEDAATQTNSTLPHWAIIVIAVMSGFVILTAIIVLLVISITWFNRVSSGHFDVEDTNTSVVTTEPTKTLFDIGIHEAQKGSSMNKDKEFDDTDDGDEFFSKLCHLRGHAEVYLSMLNDMRRRLKELPPNAPTAQQYRNVMRDVTRLLYLLNKRSSTIEVPPDGLELLSWSEQILQRYLTSKGCSSTNTSTHPTSRLSAIGVQAETNF